MEDTLTEAIRATIQGVDLVAQFVAPVDTRERFPGSDEEDIAITTIPDPANPDIPFTSTIQIGIPEIREFIYTDDNNTRLEFTYPITFDMDVRDKWANEDNALQYPNSTRLIKAIYMMVRKAFKTTPDGKPNRTFGYDNCEHQYLQQESAGTIYDEDTGKMIHSLDWSITINVMGVLN